MKQINQEALDRLVMILEKDESDLTTDDKAFLRARRSYIGKKSTERLKHILDEKPEKVDEVTEPEKTDDEVQEDLNTHPADATTPENTTPETEQKKDEEDGEVE